MTRRAGPPSSARLPALTAGEIATLIGGTLSGDRERAVSGVAPLDRAGPDQLSFLADKRYASLLPASHAGVVLVAPEFGEIEFAEGARIVVGKPFDALLALLPKFYAPPSRPPAGVHKSAVIGAGVTLGADVSIEAGAVVGDGVTIGDRTWIGPNCTISAGVTIGSDCRLVSNVSCYSGTSLGDRVVAHAGVRLGSDGFGYTFADGAHQKIPHIGRCIVENDVEIGANSCIDRGSVDDTVIGAGTKIDNLVHVGHNVRIGRLCLLMAQVGIAGSSRVGDGAILAGQVGVTGHVSIGAGARLGGQSGAISDVPAGETWSGFPARPHKEWLRAYAAIFKMSGLLKRIERLLDHEK